VATNSRACMAAAALLVAVGLVTPAQARDREAKLGDLATQLREAEQNVVAAERAAAKDPKPTETVLAKRLVEAQLLLAEGDAEGAAIKFLDLVENYGESPAGAQAVFFLGDSLVQLDMPRWAAELFSKNLGDARPDAKRFHQRSVARLFDLAVPRREDGFARKAGVSATPEVRARLQSLGVDTESTPPKGVLDPANVERLGKWAASFPAAGRLPELRYSWGRFLFLQGKPAEAMAELDGLSPIDIPISRGGPDAVWRVRAAYVAASAALATGDADDALARFSRITKVRPSDPRDRQIIELAWMALGRIHHDVDETDDAVRAYRRIGRDSPFFAEAMYETAWTLLRAERYEQAVQALDLLLIYDPTSPIVPEIKQLRGKIRVQQRDYKSAEEEFLALRREFDKLAGQLGRRLSAKGDATEYFAAVIGEDMEHFSLAAVLPVGAIAVARTLPRAVQAESLAREVGELERELADTRTLLGRMEEAVRAKDKARLFNDLAAHAAGLDNVDDDLMAVEEDLIARIAGDRDLGAAERKRLVLRDKVDRPLGDKTDVQRQASMRLQRLQEQAHKLDLFVGAMRAELVATERYYEETRKDQKIDHQGFLKDAAARRDEIAMHEGQVAALRERISSAQAALRYEDPLREARAKAVLAYRQHLAGMYGALAKSGGKAEVATLWKRAQGLHARADKARVDLDRTAGKRLEGAVVVLNEERANLDGYLGELTGKKGDTKVLVADVLAASYSDVVTELNSLVLRSEVGLLDVAWAMKEAETDEIQRLEIERDRELREIDRAVEMGLEDVE
jgi:tetratricopeptide (TPR) repeat protein